MGEVKQQFSIEGNSKTKRIKTIIGVIIGIAAAVATNYYFQDHPSIDKQLMIVASEINKTCPITVGRETRLDNTVALPDNELQYNYTLVNMEKGIDTLALRSYLIPEVTNNASTNPEMKYLRDEKVTFIYYYKDKSGQYLFSFPITPQQYEKTNSNTTI